MPTAALTPAPNDKCALPQNVLTASVVLNTIMKSVNSPPACKKIYLSIIESKGKKAKYPNTDSSS
jgi:hypothetical protein